MNNPLEIPLIKIPNRKGDIIIVNNPLFAFIYVTVYSRNHGDDRQLLFLALGLSNF